MSPQVNAAIIAAITSLIVSIINLIYNCFQAKTNKKFQKKITNIIQDKEDQRTKMQIDANIVLSARVEWIQSVRNIAAEFITALNNFIISEDDVTRKQNLELIRTKSNLLILYFGPDEHSDTVVDLFNPTSNVSKNENIVEFIKNISGNASGYFFREATIETYLDFISPCHNCKASSDIYENCNIIDTSMSEDEIKKCCNEHIGYYLARIKTLRQENQKFRDDIQRFTEIMRIYLKLEWKRAKEWNKKEH